MKYPKQRLCFRMQRSCAARSISTASREMKDGNGKGGEKGEGHVHAFSDPDSTGWKVEIITRAPEQ